MSIHDVPGSRAPRAVPPLAVPAAVPAHGPSFAHRLALRRDTSGDRKPSTPTRGVPSARTASSSAGSLTGKAPTKADASVPTTARSSTGQTSPPTRAVSLTHHQMLTVVLPLVRRITPQVLRAIASRYTAARGKPWRKGVGRVRVTVTIEGLGDITIALCKTPDGWVVEVQADPLIDCLKQI